MNYKKLIISCLLSVGLMSGCALFKPKPVLPVSIQWGKSGEQPTEVWKDYNWVIASTEQYIK